LASQEGLCSIELITKFNDFVEYKITWRSREIHI